VAARRELKSRKRRRRDFEDVTEEQEQEQKREQEQEVVELGDALHLWVFLFRHMHAGME